MTTPNAYSKVEPRRHLGWGFVGVVAVFTFLAGARQSPDLSSDAATCILSAAQLEAGRVTTYHTLRKPDQNNLDVDEVVPLSWWPKSYEALPWFFHNAGLPWGEAVSATFLVSWLVAALGWWKLYQQIAPRSAVPLLLGLMLLCRYAHNNASVYNGGEFLFWCVFPWFAWLNLVAIQTQNGPSHRLAFACGLVSPLMFLVKYSGGISVIGFAAGWLCVTKLQRTSMKQLTSWCLGVALTGGVICWTTMNSSNPASIRDQWHMAPLVWGGAAWTLAITDVEILFMKLFVHREPPLLSGTGNYGDGQMLWIMPAIWLLMLAVWLTRSKSVATDTANSNDASQKSQNSTATVFLIAHLATFTVVLCVLMATGSKIHMDARFLRPGAAALLPALLSFLWNGLRRGTTPHRAACGVSLAVLMLGVAYGAATLFYKSLLLPGQTHGQVSGVGLRHQLLSPDGNAAAFIGEIDQLANDGAILYLIDHGLAIPLARRRVIVEHAMSRSVAELESRIYRGLPEAGIVLVIPDSFVESGKLAAIQSSFSSVKEWKQQRAANQPGWLLLRGKPSPGGHIGK